MIYDRVPRDPTEMMKGNLIVSRQRIPEGYIVVYMAVEPPDPTLKTLGTTKVLSVATEKVVVKKHLCWRIWVWLFGDRYKWESRRSYLDKRVSDEILN